MVICNITTNKKLFDIKLERICLKLNKPAFKKLPLFICNITNNKKMFDIKLERICLKLNKPAFKKLPLFHFFQIFFNSRTGMIITFEITRVKIKGDKGRN